MDYLAAPLTLLGVYLLGKRDPMGWYASGVGSTLWVVYAIYTSQLPLILLNLAFIYLDLRGLYLWTRDR